jgi:hypothetical protein
MGCSGQCPLCTIVDRAEYWHVIRFGTAALETDEVRQAIYGRRGLCNAHFWRLRRCFWGAGLAQTLVDVLALVPAEGLCSGEPKTLLSETLPLEPGNCSLCAALRCEESFHNQLFADLLAHDGFRVSYQRTRGLCLPHLRAVASMVTRDVFDWLLAFEGLQWRLLQTSLQQRAQRPKSPMFRRTTPDEEESPDRCIAKLVGSNGRNWRAGV